MCQQNNGNPASHNKVLGPTRRHKSKAAKKQEGPSASTKSNRLRLRDRQNKRPKHPSATIPKKAKEAPWIIFYRMHAIVR